MLFYRKCLYDKTLPQVISKCWFWNKIKFLFWKIRTFVKMIYEAQRENVPSLRLRECHFSSKSRWMVIGFAGSPLGILSAIQLFIAGRCFLFTKAELNTWLVKYLLSLSFPLSSGLFYFSSVLSLALVCRYH